MSELFAAHALSVSELNAMAKSLLESHLFGLWIMGEVSNLTRVASGHYYFSLKDSRAQIRCAMFKDVAAKYAANLKEGDHVELTGRISIYEARGEFQIAVSELRQKGLGKLYEAYEKLKAKLQAEGVFALERKKNVPSHPRAIGIVTSLAAAALRDVLTTLKRRAPEIPVIVYPTAVQGAGSENQIAQAIQLAAERAEVDVLIVCRGGGSIEDLWSFNEEVVVRAIEACPIAVVSGVGHETDFTLTDFVADVRAPTPTAAAELASPNRLETIQKLRQAQTRLADVLRQRYYDASQRVDWLSRQLRHPQQKLAEQKSQLQALQLQLRFAMQNQHRSYTQKMVQQQQKLAHMRPDMVAARQRVNVLKDSLKQNWHTLFSQRHQRLQTQAALLDAVSPKHILQRGFSVVKNARGQVMRSAYHLKQGQKLHILFADGETDVQVTAEQGQADLFDFS